LPIPSAPRARSIASPATPTISSSRANRIDPGSNPDRYLLENDLSERCIASRLAMYLREHFPDNDVDVEYNRMGDVAKRLRGLPAECFRRRNREVERKAPVAVPDVIVHRRGPAGPNLLVIELKKTSNPEGMDCDRRRIHAFREQLGYRYGALVECATRNDPDMRVVEWIAAGGQSPAAWISTSKV
jgi:hypothetical protein